MKKRIVIPPAKRSAIARDTGATGRERRTLRLDFGGKDDDADGFGGGAA